MVRVLGLIVLALSIHGGALAFEAAGFEVNGYSRGGPLFNYDKAHGVKGGVSLGGDLQKFRLGNEGDNGLELNIARTTELNSASVKFNYMPIK